MPDAVAPLTGEYLDLVFETFPTAATVFGRHEHDGRLEELTTERLDDFTRRLAELRRRVTAVAPASEEEAVDRDALAAAISDALLAEEVERPWHRNPFEAATAVPAAILLLVARDFAPLEQRLAAAAERLEAAPGFLERAKVLLDEPCPALWRQMAVGAAGGGAEFLAGTLGPLAAGTALAGRVEAAAATAAQAMRDFAAWLAGDHAARFPDDAPFAIGEAAQARKLREVHCFDATPAEFTRIGRTHIEELTAALTEQAAKLPRASGTGRAGGSGGASETGGSGGVDWSATLDRLKGDHPDADGLLPAYRRELQRLESFVFQEDLATNPDAEARVEPTPEFLRPVMGFAAYLPAGPFDAWQQGYFWVTPPPDEAGLRDHAFATIPAVAAHEGYPGHHLQMTSVNRIPSLTRRAIRSPVMIEGWGLYTEQLMADVGYYDDAARLAQLAMRLLRALRIVLDMELQSGELTYEAAVERAVTVARLEESTARSEVARYTMTPTQPFSYLVGCLELERLRAASQARLGEAFRLRRFHDRVLSYGHMPPTLVARAITAADEAEQRRPPDDG
ncbi:MAG TPA: DUF885 domain-containing protein [Actinomycetota bacterium]|nr:DUF885 domain-containing protein [Actinomycetota bacterium]